MGVTNQNIAGMIQNMVASNTNMPISSYHHICQVTEIVIRCGPPEGLRIINPLTPSLPCGGCGCSPCCCPPPLPPSIPSLPSGGLSSSGVMTRDKEVLLGKIFNYMKNP
jgi:hypothetical protein